MRFYIILLLSSMIIRKTIRRPLPYLTETVEPKKCLSDAIYGSFNFKDRMTNTQFSYSQVANNSQISFEQWIPRKSQSSSKLNHIVNTYKYTKKFQMKCLRKKYQLIKKDQNQDNQLESKTFRISENSMSKSMTRTMLFNKSKKQLRRVLDTGGSVSPEYLQGLVNNPDSNNKKVAKKNNKWLIRDNHVQKENLGEEGKRIYERAINHMNFELRHKGQYLFNLPQHIKRKHLINQQFRHRQKDQKQNHQSIISKPKQKLSSLQFSMRKKQGPMKIINTGSTRDEIQEIKELITAVGQGFINQVFVLISNKIDLVHGTDNKGHNVFHIAAKQNNDKMLRNLFRVIPVHLVQSLLKHKNKMGRTPLQKAEQFGNKESIYCIQQYMKQHKL